MTGVADAVSLLKSLSLISSLLQECEGGGRLGELWGAGRTKGNKESSQEQGE